MFGLPSSNISPKIVPLEQITERANWAILWIIGGTIQETETISEL